MFQFCGWVVVLLILCPDKPKKPTERLVIDLKAPVRGYGITMPPKGMSETDWKKGKMRDKF